MDVQRTPDERFVDLADWPYQPSYATVTASDIDIPLRLAYVDVGPETGRSVLLIHGEPTWGYLYRKMIPGLVEAGCRVVVPDLIGFGRSDKPAQKSDYTYARHIDWVSSLVEQLDLQDTVLFGQDWGSLIGMAVVARYPERFAAVMIGNGGLPDPEHRDQMMAAQQTSPDPGAFLRWQQHAAQLDSMNVSETLRRGLADIPGAAIKLTDAEAAAYDAPFPDRTYQAGPLIFPALASPHGHEGSPFTPVCSGMESAGDVAKAVLVPLRSDRPHSGLLRPPPHRAHPGQHRPASPTFRDRRPLHPRAGTRCPRGRNPAPCSPNPPWLNTVGPG